MFNRMRSPFRKKYDGQINRKGRVRWGLWALLAGSTVLLAAGCGPQPPSPPDGTGNAVLHSGQVAVDVQSANFITIGDVAKDSPSRIFKEYSALAAYLGSRLENAGVEKVEVAVAKDLEKLALLVNNGELDVFFGNTVNATLVGRQADALPILRQWKRGTAESYSVFLVKRDSGITALDQLVGNVISFQAPHSGAGYLLPRAFLQEMGFTLTRIDTPDTIPEPEQIGYINTTGERTSLELLSTGRVQATVVGEAA